MASEKNWQKYLTCGVKNGSFPKNKTFSREIKFFPPPPLVGTYNSLWSVSIFFHQLGNQCVCWSTKKCIGQQFLTEIYKIYILEYLVWRIHCFYSLIVDIIRHYDCGTQMDPPQTITPFPTQSYTVMVTWLNRMPR